MSGCAAGIQRLEQTCAGHSKGLEAGQGGGHLCSASPTLTGPTCTWHGTCWRCPFTPGAGSVTPLALCHLGLAAGSAASWGLAPELDQSLSQVGSPMLGCPCQSCSSPSGVLPMSRSLLFPFLSTSCFPQNPSPRRLWRSPFPPGGRRQLRVHGSKWSH